MTPTGIFDADNRTLSLQREFAASAPDVWAGITESERLARWFGTWTGDPSTGRIMVTMNAEAEAVPPAPYEIHACEPPHRLDVSAIDEYGQWRLVAELVEADGRTTLTLRQEDVDTDTLGETGPGWEWYLDRLVADVAGTPLPSLADFDDEYMPLAAAYAALSS
ncbi:SRPBCC family protein [Microbacterium sp. NPDC028030]|uniref:SRPBCC family protein n=1 Tax=Microbacterium sp. NPDC028030 TaxID=3155124 RepID=UPI0033FB1BDB